jgi:hypothetical protein
LPDWKLIFDGKTISLHPSIGNWSFACKSYYWIRNNHATWAPRWSREEIERGRSDDRLAKEAYFGDIDAVAEDVPTPAHRKQRKSIWQSLKGLWR